jgi:hypothetical protein
MEIAAGDLHARQGMRGQIDAAQRVQLQPAAVSGLWKGPEYHGHPDRTRQSHGHRGDG